MANPIWKDVWIDLGQADSVEFSLVTGGVTIYTGKAYKRPDSDSVTIRINDIVADYLGRVRPSLSDGAFSEDTYELEVSVQVNGEEVQSVTFCNDWSYDYGHDASVDGISAPINGRASSLAPLILSVYDAQRVRLDVTYKDGTTSFQIVSIEQRRNFSDDFSNDFAIIEGRESGTGAVAFDLSKFGPDVQSVEVEGNVYDVSSCGDFVLYYVNSYGGWDTFLVEGLVKRRDALKRFERSRIYDNTDPANRGRDNYLNEITQKVEMHTGWLSDAQSLRMHHLLNSPSVYLYDIAEGQLLPLVLTDTTTEYKTFKGNGRKLVNYTINADIAHDIVRR